MKKRSILLTLTCCFATACPLIAQQTEEDTLQTNELAPVTVSAYRLEMTDVATPLSMTRLGEKQLQTATQQLGLDEALMSVPGLFVQNGTNFAQDIRVSIRGFGARSAFGIRGVKILVDGIPESTPDGTAQVDAVDPGALTGLTVIRSGTGGLYGNASGGSINFNTLKFNDKEWREAGVSFGSYYFRKTQLRFGGGTANKFLYSFNGSYTGQRGYRNHSAMENFLANVGFLVPLDSTLTLKGVLTYVYSPKAEDPGGLDKDEAKDTPTKSNNTVQNVGEKLWQYRYGISIDKKLSRTKRLSANLFHTDRSFEAFLPGDYTALERSFTGGTVAFHHSVGKVNAWDYSLGLDIQSQNDHRKRFGNDGGKRTDELLLNQFETFFSSGAYWVNRIALGKRFSMLPAVRFDLIEMKVRDILYADLQDNGLDETYLAFNPSLGLSFLVSPTLNIYMNGSRNFETPTLAEISRSFNALKPQNSITAEIGLKYVLPNGKLRFEVSAYRIWLNKEISLYDEGFFASYRNVGKSRRQGIEFGFYANLGQHFSTSGTVTFSKNWFKEYQDWFTDYNGNHIPGFPDDMASLNLTYQNGPIFFNYGNQYVNRIYIDDENSDNVKPYLLGSLKVGLTRTEATYTIQHYLGLNNLYDTEYNANIRINNWQAYEPAPPRNFYLGFKIQF